MTEIYFTTHRKTCLYQLDKKILGHTQRNLPLSPWQENSCLYRQTFIYHNDKKNNSPHSERSSFITLTKKILGNRQRKTFLHQHGKNTQKITFITMTRKYLSTSSKLFLDQHERNPPPPDTHKKNKKKISIITMKKFLDTQWKTTFIYNSDK